jgi:hypothetical protein
VSPTSLTPDEIRAAAETHHELGPDYQSAVIESFLDKVGQEIDARVDARLAAAQPMPGLSPYQPNQPQPRQANPRNGSFALAVVSMVLGIPLTGIVAGTHLGIWALTIIWIAIAVINIAYATRDAHAHFHAQAGHHHGGR